MRNPAVQTSEAVPKPPSCLHFVEAACPPCPDGPSLLVAKAVIITSGPTATRSRTTGHNTQLASTPPQEATQACPLRQPGQALNGPRQAGQRLPPSTGAPHEQRRRQFTRQAARSRASSWQLSSARSLTLSLSLSLSLSLPISEQSPSLTYSPSGNQPASTFV